MAFVEAWIKSKFPNAKTGLKTTHMLHKNKALFNVKPNFSFKRSLFVFRGPGPEDDDGGGFFAATAGHDFLELESGGQLDLEGCLEPEGLESEALEGQVLDDERVDFDGIGEEIPEELLNKVAAHTSAQSQNGQVRTLNNDYCISP